MSAITLDPELRARLNGLTEEIGVRDEKGVTIGYFVPAKEYLKLLYAWARTQPVDEAEIERAHQSYKEHGGLSTAQAIAHLEQVARGTQGP